MKLKYLQLAQFRQFDGTLRIDGLDGGLNLFVGPNESGKSTVAEAIRAAFFERHNTSSVDHLQPWGDSAAAPQIELAFVCQGQNWLLNKRFLKQARCDLQCDTQQFSGAEAEQALADLLGYAIAPRGASRDEHHGIPGLLWIEQGHTQELAAAVGHASERLNAALAAQVGDLASSSGDAVIAEVQRQRDQWLTPKAGNPTGDYKKTLDALEQGQAKLAELQSQISRYHDQVDTLGRLLQQQVDIDAAEPWLAAEAQAKDAKIRLAEAQEWEREQQQDQKTLNACQDNLQLYRDQLLAMDDEANQLKEREQDRLDAQNALQRCLERKPQLDADHDLAKQAYEQAEALCKQVRAQAHRQLLQTEHDRLAQTSKDKQQAAQKAQQLQASITTLRGQLQAVDEQQLTQLKTIHAKLSELQIRQAVVATRLQYDLLPGQALQLGQDKLHGQGERQLLESTELHIPGVGRLRLHPGGRDIADLARQQRQLQQRSANLLLQLGVATLAEAEQRAASNQDIAQQIREQQIELRTLAPDGAQALADASQQDQQRLAQLAAQLNELPPARPDLPNEAAAASKLQQATTALRQAEQALADYNGKLAAAQQAEQAANKEWQRLHSALTAPDRKQREQQANKKIIDLKAEASQLNQAIQARSQRISAARPDILQQDVERHSRSAHAMRAEADQRKTRITSLQAELRALGAQDVQDQYDALASKVAALQTRKDEITRQTEALDLLLDLLNTERAEITRQLQAPLQKHLQHYLHLLFPQASLSVDDQLLPQTLTRQQAGRTQAGDLEQLSFGAREQMGLLSRLAYADLLQDAGRPTLIILDDALVHSDSERLDQMKRILFDAATRHQILLFSCHPERWRDLGVRARDLPGLKATAS